MPQYKPIFYRSHFKISMKYILQLLERNSVPCARGLNSQNYMSLLNFVLGVLVCLRTLCDCVFGVISMLTCLHAWRACVLMWSGAWRGSMFTYSRAQRAQVFKCLRAHVLSMLFCFMSLCAYMSNMLDVLNYLTFLQVCVFVCVCVFTSIHRKGFTCLWLKFQGTDQRCCVEVTFLCQVLSSLLQYETLSLSNQPLHSFHILEADKSMTQLALSMSHFQKHEDLSYHYQASPSVRATS